MRLDKTFAMIITQTSPNMGDVTYAFLDSKGQSVTPQEANKLRSMIVSSQISENYTIKPESQSKNHVKYVLVFSDYVLEVVLEMNAYMESIFQQKGAKIYNLRLPIIKAILESNLSYLRETFRP